MSLLVVDFAKRDWNVTKKGAFALNNGIQIISKGHLRAALEKIQRA
jgi:hypothetical protein